MSATSSRLAIARRKKERVLLAVVGTRDGRVTELEAEGTASDEAEGREGAC